MSATVSEENTRIVVAGIIGVNVSDLSSYSMNRSLRIYSHKTLPLEFFAFSLLWNDSLDGMTIRSSRLILASKDDGRILYDGPAHDEG